MKPSKDPIITGIVITLGWWSGALTPLMQATVGGYAYNNFRLNRV